MTSPVPGPPIDTATIRARAESNREVWREDVIALLDLADRQATEIERLTALVDRVAALVDDEPNWNGPAVNSEVRWFANDVRAALSGSTDV